MSIDFPPTREAGLACLQSFVPRAGRDYARLRNYDLDNHPHVSGLSPYIRRRLITEHEVLEVALARHSPTAAEKFVQEVFWRTYWKGWLERRPAVWDQYKASLHAAFNRVPTEAGLRAEYTAACQGETEIKCFNFWAQQLVETGYLHNHARMWFASIWIFTLRLPWELGADFFLRHLLDGDPASNTLSWRWVAGLQTIGKTYLARPDNIAKYTDGRFTPDPNRLATFAAPLDGAPHAPLGPAPTGGRIDPTLKTGLILHDDDINFSPLINQITGPCPFLRISTVAQHSPRAVAPAVIDFATHALERTVSVHRSDLGEDGGVVDTPDAVVAWAKTQDLQQITLLYPTTGPARDTLAPLLKATEAANIRVVEWLPPYDQLCWSHARAGFFKFKSQIPKLLTDLKLDRQADLFA